MSTKVYDAYKYDGDLKSLIDTLKTLRKQYQEDKIETLSKFENLEIEVEDGKKVLLKNLQEEILGEMFFGMYLEKAMRKGYNLPSNIQASAVVYSYEDDLYVKFFGIKSEYIDDLSGFTDYHYQNQSDISNYDWDAENWEDMTEERQKELEDDWDIRCKVWDDIIGNETFSEAGLLFDFHPSGYNMTMFCNEILMKIKNNNHENKF